MATVLVVASKPAERAFFTEVLRAGGHAPLADAAPSTPAPPADVVLADVESAAARGWLGPGAAPPPGRLVLTSPFAALLAPWRASFATVLLPAPAGDVLAAVNAPGARPEPSRTPLDWVHRDARLQASGVDASQPDPALTRIAQLVARSSRAEMALVTMVSSQEQRFLGQTGLPDDLALQGGTPRAWSFCQHVVAADATLVVTDAARHPALADTPLVETSLIRAYAGVPVRVEGVGAVGTVCVLSDKPREFSDHEIASLELAARLVEERLALTLAAPPSPPPALPVTRPASPPPSPPSAAGDRTSPARTPRPQEMAHTVYAGSDSPMEELSPSQLTEAPASAAEPSASAPLLLLEDAAPAARSLLGSFLDGKYWVTAHLGGGGMSEVYLARDRVVGNLVAIKVLLSSLGDDLLVREARLLAAIRHPCIVQVHGWGSAGETGKGRMYLVLEYVRGVELLQKLNAAAARGGGLPPEDALRILRNLAGALDTMHGVGLVHGDMKPANVLIDEAFDRAVIIDFGLAMRMPEPGAPAETPAQMGGTPGYSAPEQLVVSTAFKPSPSQDVYALGAIAYALLTGTGPFSHLPMSQRLAAQRAASFEPVSRRVSGLPAGTDAVLARALSADPSKRQCTPSELVDALASALGGSAPAPVSRAAPVPMSRAGIFAMARDAVTAQVGPKKAAALLAGLDAADRAAFSPGAAPDESFPARALVAYLRAFAARDRALLEKVGQSLGAATLPAAVRALEIGRSPYTFLRAFAPLHQRFHAWGQFEYTQTTVSSAAVRVRMEPSLAPEMCSLIGGVMRALVTLAAGDASVDHTECAGAGAEACELRIRWPA